ncbi:hypothetical protein B7494_g4447 [Chlorociboria aeruginascens]|nr:hypothetical protein B7494_g4447 [Chlorociboria aeruginascens]
MSPLTSFTIFMQLPLDIRVVIWRLAMPRNRIVRLYEEIEVEDDDATWFETGTSRDSTVYSNEYLDRVLSTYRRFSNRGQTQLEAYNFTSTTPRPSLLTDDQLEQASKLEWETTRQGRWRSSSPIPVLLYVCRESRDLLQAYGYKIAFSTRTAKAQTWFNFSEDYLYLLSGDIDSLDISVTLDGGYWNIGQLCSEDLGLVKRLALSLDRASDYRGSRSFPTSLYHAVQIFGNLEELLLVCRDSDYLVDPKYAYGVADDWRTGLVAVDVQAEEYFGHYCDWDGEYSPEGNRFREGVSFLGPWPIGDVDYSFGAMAKDIEKKLQNHEPLANGMGINREVQKMYEMKGGEAGFKSRHMYLK